MRDLKESYSLVSTVTIWHCCCSLIKSLQIHRKAGVFARRHLTAENNKVLEVNSRIVFNYPDQDLLALDMALICTLILNHGAYRDELPRV